MQPEEIRARVFAEHEQLRGQLDEIDGWTRRFENGEEVGSEICELGVGLFELFASHLALEDSLLAPALAELAPDGEALADRLVREHDEQRAMLRYLLRRLEEARRPTALIANELRSFAGYLRRDMQHEEETILREGLLAAPA